MIKYDCKCGKDSEVKKEKIKENMGYPRQFSRMHVFDEVHNTGRRLFLIFLDYFLRFCRVIVLVVRQDTRKYLQSIIKCKKTIFILKKYIFQINGLI
jgi:hypothetical protein